ncbi:MAG: hypothetical protein KGI58_02100 [Patescibacteria group bacterium]|nr:hypothetical protein [Patescibacteria group bacterium]
MNKKVVEVLLYAKLKEVDHIVDYFGIKGEFSENLKDLKEQFSELFSVRPRPKNVMKNIITETINSLRRSSKEILILESTRDIESFIKITLYKEVSEALTLSDILFSLAF